MTVRRGITCREVVELATDYFEANLASDASERFAAHVAHCDGCQAYLRQIRITVDIVHTVAAPGPVDPAGLVEDFRRWRAGRDGGTDADGS
jgi:putative zinc finger protein